MATIHKIRLTNIVYEEGNKRFNDEVFYFNGSNSAIVLENGGGKTVFIHTVLQAILPHTNLGERKIKETLQVENAPAHIGIEWLIHENPRRYATTAVSLFMQDNQLRSLKYSYDYEPGDRDSLENIPFVKGQGEDKRPAIREEMMEYFTSMKSKSMNARTFDTNKAFHEHIEQAYHIVMNEWESVVKINRDEGGIEQFFDNCKTTTDLFNRLLIPTVEDSLAGYEDGKFANIFEDRREGFHMYHNLQHSLREYQLIEEKIKDYVDQFANYSEQEAAYERTKQRAKAFDILLEKQAAAIAKAHASQTADVDKVEESLAQLSKDKASYAILRAEKTEKELQSSYREEQARLDKAVEKKKQAEDERATLQYAEEKKNLSVAQEQKEVQKRALAEKDQAEEVSDLQAELEKLDRQIHGHYMKQIDALGKTIKQAEFERRPLEDDKEKLNTSINEKKKERRELERKIDKTDAEIRFTEEEMNKIKGRILANPQQEDVHKSFEEWMKTRTQLDESIISAQNEVRLKGNEKSDLEKALTSARQQLHEIRLGLKEIEYEEAQLNQAQDKTIEALASIRATWQGLNDLYLKESSITHSLADLQEQRVKEREQILQKERLAHRFTDDYGRQSYFFTDPVLAEKIIGWQNDLFVKTGTQYIAELPPEEKEKASQFKLWPLTLVTLATDKDKLQEKILAIKEELQDPVIVVTLEQAKQITEQADEAITFNEIVSTWITPPYWETNMTAESFANWQAEMKKKAETATIERQAADVKVEKIKQVGHYVNEFFTIYPKDKYEGIRKKKHEQEEAEESTERTIGLLKNQLEKIERTIDQMTKEIADKQDQLRGVDDQLAGANDIFQFERKIHNLGDKQRERREKISSFTNEIRSLSRDLEACQAEIAAIDEEIADKERALRDIEVIELYKEVQRTRPIFTNDALEVMRDKRKRLELNIHGIEQQYNEIRVRLDHAEETIERAKERMAYLLGEHDTIDRAFDFPVDGKSRISRLTNTIQAVQVSIEQLTEEVGQAKSAYDQQSGRLKSAIEQFAFQFPGQSRTEFSIELNDIENYLQNETNKLSERKNYVQQRIAQIEKEQGNIRRAATELDRFKEAHHFHKTNVTASKLSDEERTEFAYKRIATVHKLTEMLKENYAALNKEVMKIAKAKDQFRAFCRQNISDRKLREAAIEGMETKESYDDILAYKKDMFTTLENASKHARYFIAKNDKDVQTFINNIHNHLLNVTAELGLIPNKTRVRTADKAKNIYKFDIPTWHEEEGKQAIRDHLDWILSRLETDDYKDEHGKEDTTKVRKQVETWLQTKALLQVVMQNDEMTISCRKVTNDNQVTSRFTRWERSNQWSGGEKWSKNMTLFLGLLNYVAEKQKQTNPNLKRNRAVILDNPFGKASSDHVLDPVFFIAEQLGFQIIALTAHADGKFLQDYFPIIYSLRLRNTAVAGKQVMSSKRRVNKAYFEDHEPEALARLEKREQLGFDLRE